MNTDCKHTRLTYVTRSSITFANEPANVYRCQHCGASLIAHPASRFYVPEQ